MNESFRFASVLEQNSPVALQHEVNIDFTYPEIYEVIWTQVWGLKRKGGREREKFTVLMIVTSI